VFSLLKYEINANECEKDSAVLYDTCPPKDSAVSDVTLITEGNSLRNNSLDSLSEHNKHLARVPNILMIEMCDITQKSSSFQ